MRVRRDMDPSAFAPILDELLARCPVVHATVLVDAEGETVDYAFRRLWKGTAFDLRVVAAHLKLLLRPAPSAAPLGSLQLLYIAAEKRGFVAVPLPGEYALVLVTTTEGAFSVSWRAVAVCARALSIEAGWQESVCRSWYAVDVPDHESGRPRSIRPSKEPRDVHVAEILGRVSQLPPNQTGYRARLDGGLEVTLIREGRFWYADEDILRDSSRPPKKR